MVQYTQTDRPMSVTTPLGADVLLLRGFEGREAISHLFEFSLNLVAENEVEVPFEKLLGQKIIIRIDLPTDHPRYLCGICNRMGQGARDATFTSYHLGMVPQFWFLTRRVQSRIFQHVTIPEILKDVLSGLDVAFQVQGTYQPRDYCVQYRESDFAFASRLMEEEGIRYFFLHAADGHTMVVTDVAGDHPELSSSSTIPFEEQGNRDPEAPRVTAWEKVQELRSGKVTLWDHCFELPHKHLEADKLIPDSVAAGQVNHKLMVSHNDKLEVYDYPGGYAQRFDGVDRGGAQRPAELEKIFEDNKRTVGIRMQQETVPGLVIRGQSNCRHLVSGHTFSLAQHFNANGQYLLTSIEHSGHFPDDYRSGNGQEATYENTFTCIPAAVPYRPVRETPRPTVRGTQTAVVVGPAGEEIFTDKYSRVKVQFHWDRQGQNNADSSCWIRVATPWAGKTWGAIHIPRIGQEVVVDFLEGDPDQPIIIGSVYNADQMPPFPLPGGKVISGTKSKTYQGAGYNEMVFDDTPGKELIRVHGQYDKDATVEHDLREHVLNCRNRDVTSHETISIGKNQTITVGANRTETVTGNESVSIHGYRTHTTSLASFETVYGFKNLGIIVAYTVEVGGGMVEGIGGAKAMTIGGYYFVGVKGRSKEIIGSHKTVSVLGNLKESVRGNQETGIAGDLAETVKGKQGTTITGDLTESVGANHTEAVTEAYSLSAKSVTITAEEKIELKCGDASITLQSDGLIQIGGKTIDLEATSEISAMAESKVELEGGTFKITSSSGEGDVEATTILTLKGQQTRINC